MDPYRKLTQACQETSGKIVRNYTVSGDRGAPRGDGPTIHYLLNRQVTQLMFLRGFSMGLTQSLPSTTTFHLTASRLTDPRVSFDDRYVGFKDGSNLKTYEFPRKKMIWRTVPHRHGKVLAYQWLPDREALLLFKSGVGANPN